MHCFARISGVTVSVRGAPRDLSRFSFRGSSSLHSSWSLSGKGNLLKLEMANHASSRDANTLDANNGSYNGADQANRSVSYGNNTPSQRRENRGQASHQNQGTGKGRGYHGNTRGRGPRSQDNDRRRAGGNSWNWHGDDRHRSGPYPSQSRGSDNYNWHRQGGNYGRPGDYQQRSGHHPSQFAGSDHSDSLVYLSKSLAWILRHAAENQGLNFLPGGFLYVDDILQLQRFRGFRIADVQRVVAENDKQRFALQMDQESNRPMIRANQGHSVQVEDLELMPVTLENADNYPKVIHGTYMKNWESIKKEGLRRMTRNHIHFAIGEPGAEGVISGMRNSCEVLIFLDLKAALKDGLEFFLSSNNVVLSPGDKHGRIYPCYFDAVQHRSPRYILEFDKTISSMEVSAQGADREHEEKGKKKKKKKNKQNKGDSMNRKEKAEKNKKEEEEPSGGYKGGESRMEDGGTIAKEGGVRADGGGAEGEGGTTGERRGVAEEDGNGAMKDTETVTTASGIDEGSENKGDNPPVDKKRKNGDSDMEVDDSAATVGEQQSVSSQSDAAGKVELIERDSVDMELAETMEVDQGAKGVTDGDTETKKQRKAETAYDEGKQSSPVIQLIESMERIKEAVEFIENIDKDSNDNFITVACFPDKAQKFSTLCISDVCKNIYIVDLSKCPDCLSENEPLFDLIENNKSIAKVLYNCVPTCKTLFEEYEICVSYVRLCDVQTMYEDVAKLNSNLDFSARGSLWSIAQQLSCSGASVTGDERIDWDERPLTDDMVTAFKTTLMTLMEVYQTLRNEIPSDKYWKRQMYEKVKAEIDDSVERALFEKRKAIKIAATKKDPSEQVSKDSTSKKKGNKKSKKK